MPTRPFHIAIHNIFFFFFYIYCIYVCSNSVSRSRSVYPPSVYVFIPRVWICDIYIIRSAFNWYMVLCVHTVCSFPFDTIYNTALLICSCALDIEHGAAKCTACPMLTHLHCVCIVICLNACWHSPRIRNKTWFDCDSVLFLRRKIPLCVHWRSLNSVREIFATRVKVLQFSAMHYI